jgi:hypothetical protein
VAALHSSLAVVQHLRVYWHVPLVVLLPVNVRVPLRVAVQEHFTVRHLSELVQHGLMRLVGLRVDELQVLAGAMPPDGWASVTQLPVVALHSWPGVVQLLREYWHVPSAVAVRLRVPLCAALQFATMHLSGLGQQGLVVLHVAELQVVGQNFGGGAGATGDRAGAMGGRVAASGPGQA